MTAPRNTPHASAIAAITASQNTAPVAEFRCLFTHDIRRKQKRWQDGYLKFHTFNNRVMVYDQARNFLGDTYYKDSNELHEGDELSLNNGALVEVAEPMGVTQTDLTPLFEKKTAEAPPRPTAASQTRPFQRPSSVAPTNAQRNASQLRHKSLNTLLGTPKGPIGKAQPMRSPYEVRKEKENEQAEERTPKRQKIVQSPAKTWRASSPIQEESPVARPSEARNIPKPAKFVPPAANVITIDIESDPAPTILSDVTLPSTPPKIARARAEARALPTPTSKPEKPAIQTPKIPRGKVPVPHVKALETPKQVAPPSSPPVSASNRLTNVDFALQPSTTPSRDSSTPPVAPPARKAKALRLSTGVKRGTLLCQALPQHVPRAGSEPRVGGTGAKTRKSLYVASKEPSPALSHNGESHLPDDAPTTGTEPTLSKSKRRGAEVDHVAQKRMRVSKSAPEPSPDLSIDPEVVHGIMDQQLLVSSPPVRPPRSPSPVAEKAPRAKPSATKKPISKKSSAPKRLSPQAPEPEAAKSKSPPSKEAPRKAQPRKEVVEQVIQEPEAAPATKASLPSVSVLAPSLPPTRDVSPTHSEASNTTPRTASASPYKAGFSTGGFPIKPSKRSKKKPKPASLETAHNDTIPFPDGPAQQPPAPTRATKKGPLISTTELAAQLLQKPKKGRKNLDPIEDDTGGAGAVMGKSPNRSFRRVRSENDAPIPSTADDWEKRNLPKPVENAQDDPGPAKKKSALSVLINKTDPRRKLKRTQSLQVETNGRVVDEVLEVQSPVMDKDVGPWSTEAGDLFDWRPPTTKDNE